MCLTLSVSTAYVTAVSLVVFNHERSFRQRSPYVVISFDEYWFAILLCETMDPTGVWKIAAGLNLSKVEYVRKDPCKFEMHLLSKQPINMKDGAKARN
jgi:hypothetical protein